MPEKKKKKKPFEVDLDSRGELACQTPRSGVIVRIHPTKCFIWIIVDNHLVATVLTARTVIV